MKGSNIISATHHVRLAKEFFNDFTRENPNTKGAELFKRYILKLDWILTDMKSTPALPQIVRDAMRHEFNSDVFSFPAVSEKIALLKPEHREAVEELIDELLKKEKCY